MKNETCYTKCAAYISIAEGHDREFGLTQWGLSAIAEDVFSNRYDHRNLQNSESEEGRHISNIMGDYLARGYDDRDHELATLLRNPSNFREEFLEARNKIPREDLEEVVSKIQALKNNLDRSVNSPGKGMDSYENAFSHYMSSILCGVSGNIELHLFRLE